MKTAILIIAAGNSSRLGQPKQLVPYQKTFLLEYIIQQCERSGIGAIFMVLGANRDLIEPKIKNSNVKVIHHPDWAIGMGSSIACGVSVIQDLGYESVIVMLGDQPFFQSNILKKIFQKHQKTNARIISSRYEKGMGPPVFFDISLFEELKLLTGDIGAKPIIRKYFDEVEYISFSKGHIDIDTPNDLKLLKP